MIHSLAVVVVTSLLSLSALPVFFLFPYSLVDLRLGTIIVRLIISRKESASNGALS